MSVEMPLNEDHEVLGSEFCSGYSDALGRWNPGFYCPPREDASDALFCCGGATYKYCCTQREHATAEDIGNLPLVLGVALGATAAIGIIILVCACFCQCCQPKAKDSQQAKQAKQQAKQSADGPVYRMQTSSTASGVANMYSFSNQNSLATTPIDTAASQIMVELEPGAVGRTGTMGRGNTFCASGARTLQRNGGHDPPPPYDAGKSAHHTLPHQRHHHQHQQHPHQQQQHPPPPQQHLYPPDSPPQVRQHFTLPRSHGMQSARSPNTTFPQGPPHAGHGLGHGLGHGHAAHPTATLSRVPRAVPASVPVVPVVPVPVVKPPPGPLPLPPGVGPAGLQPPGLQQPGPTSPGPRSPVDSPHRGFQTHTLRHPPSNAVPLHAGGYGMTGMTHSTSSTFQPCPPPQQQQQQPPPQQHPQLLQQHQHLPPQPQMQQQQQGGAGLPPPPNMPAPIPVGPPMAAPMGPPMAAPMGPPMGPPMGNPMGPMVVGAPPKGMGAATPLGPGPAMGPMGPAMGPAATNGVPGLVNGANGPNGPNGTELSPGDTLYRSTKF